MIVINTKNVDAFLIGCSEYHNYKDNLLFVNNDIKELKNSLINSMKISEKNISSYSGMVEFDDYKDIIDKICTNETENEMLILYFSGHGRNKKGSSIVLSDERTISINDLLSKISESKYKCKWIIIDACYSGQFILNEEELLVGEGTIVTCSSSKEQPSFANEKKSMSYFTEILCNILNFESTKNKSLAEIINLIRMIYKNDNSKQTLINRQNFLGTIYFSENENIKKGDKRIIKYEYKDDDFCTIGFEPIHSLSVKKYCVYIVSKLQNEKKLSIIMEKMVKLFNKIEFYNYDKQKNMLKNKPIDFLWAYIYPDEFNFNIRNAKYIIEYKNNKGITIKEQKCFDFILENRINNTISDEELIHQINYLYNESLEELKELYKIIQEIKNSNWNEKSSYKIYISSKEKINEIYDEFINLPYGSNDFETKYEVILDYFNNVQDLLLFMSSMGQERWNNEDTRYSMIDVTMNKINKLLNYLKKEKD